MFQFQFQFQPAALEGFNSFHLIAIDQGGAKNWVAPRRGFPIPQFLSALRQKRSSAGPRGLIVSHEIRASCVPLCVNEKNETDHVMIFSA